MYNYYYFYLKGEKND